MPQKTMSSVPIRNILPENPNRHTKQDCCGDKKCQIRMELGIILSWISIYNHYYDLCKAGRKCNSKFDTGFIQ